MYNISKKKIKVAGTVPSYAQMLSDQNKERNLTLGDSTPNLNGLLDSVRRDQSADQVHEANLKESRDSSFKADGVTESQLGSRKSYVVHRTDKSENVHMKPMDALSEAYDQKFRKAYSEAEEDGDTKFWDKFVGDQMLSDTTKISGNVPDIGNQLSNNPERFESLKGQPSNSLATDNFSSYTKRDNIKPMTMASSLKDADAMLFSIYYRAASQNRDVNKREQDLIEAISAEKRVLLAQLDPSMDPSMDPTQPNNKFSPTPPLASPVEGDNQPSNGDSMGLGDIDGLVNIDNPVVNNDPEHRDVDFHDGNPTVDAPVPGSLPPDIDDRYDAYNQSIVRETPMIKEVDETPF